MLLEILITRNIKRKQTSNTALAFSYLLFLRFSKSQLENQCSVFNDHLNAVMI